MNVSTIVDMINADPTIPNDVPGFLTRVNLKNVPLTTKVTQIVTDVLTTTSIAEISGGLATAADVAAAVALIAVAGRRVQYAAKLQQVMDSVQAAIDAGTVTSLATLKAAFSSAVQALT